MRKTLTAALAIAPALLIAIGPHAKAQETPPRGENSAATAPAQTLPTPIVRLADGRLQGRLNPATQIRVFKGIPFAAPPVGALRWKAPQPVAKWQGVRPADAFGPRAMQRPLYSDMIFRSNGMSEDCLYLNVWTPAKSRRSKLPVLVYFYGGGFNTGDGSEGRYDGESMARRGIVAVTVNYRLGVFGFFSHPELSREATYHASGNYGLLDQTAALRWVQKNIAAFGGDAKKVTIAGESAGSISVSAQMASPLSRGLMARAIGESGSILATLAPNSLPDAEADGLRFAAGLGVGAAPPLAALRAVPAEQLLQATAQPNTPNFRPTLDGYFFPRSPLEIFAAGQQNRVPLLAGVNSEESGAGGVLGREAPTVENYRQALNRLYPTRADAVYTLYPATSELEVRDAARDLASDRFIRYGTWKWAELASKTGGQPTYYYLFSRARPATRDEVTRAAASSPNGVPLAQAATVQLRGAVHSAEIEYALGNLDRNPVYAWTPEDYRVSALMQNYFANFIKTADPNGAGLPLWPKFASGQHLVIDVNPRTQSNAVSQARSDLFDSLLAAR